MRNPKDCRKCGGVRCIGRGYPKKPCPACTGDRHPDLRWHAYKMPGYWHVRSPRRPGEKYQHYAFTTGAETLAALAGGDDRV